MRVVYLGQIPAHFGVIVFIGTFLFVQTTKALEVEFIGADKLKVLEKPKYLKICHRSDKHLNECIKSSLEKFMESVNSGSSEYVLPSIDPIEIPLLEIQEGAGNVSLNVILRDLTIFGFSNFNITSVKSNIVDNKFEISMVTPFIDMVAKFTAEGGVYTFPIAGEGDFSLNMTDVSAVFIIHLGTESDLPGVSYFTVEKAFMDVLPGDINAQFGEYIDGSNVIGSAMNTFFNDNAHEIFRIIKPQVNEVLAKVTKAIANEILSRHPEKTLLPD